MHPPRSSNVTQALLDARSGDRAEADRLFVETYNQLRDLARRYLRRESPGITLQPTALVHEAYLKLIDQDRVDWQGRTHFFAVGAQAMRRILVDTARRRRAQKRGDGQRGISIQDCLTGDAGRDEDVLHLNDALQTLQQLDARQAQLAELRYFGGLSVAEAAEVLGISKRTAERDWMMARAWLRRELQEGSDG
jgi:RNA polymerase sigma factor (TIGR02999 family)